MTIWKFPFPTIDAFEMNMPRGAKILSVQTQRDVPCMWCLVDPREESETVRFRVYGTGHPCESSAEQFIGTYQLRGGALVFHVFRDQ